MKEPSAVEPVLLVEPHDAVRRLILRLMARWGVTAVVATDAADALAEFETHRPALAIVDSGVEASRAPLACALRECSAGLPIVVLVGGAMAPPLQELSTDPGVWVMRKPLSAADLATLESLVDGKG